MEIIKLNGTKINKDTVCAIGFFDGVHAAHKKLINEMVDYGNKHNLKKGVITFDVHPKSILFDLINSIFGLIISSEFFFTNIFVCIFSTLQNVSIFTTFVATAEIVFGYLAS